MGSCYLSFATGKLDNFGQSKKFFQKKIWKYKNILSLFGFYVFKSYLKSLLQIHHQKAYIVQMGEMKRAILISQIVGCIVTVSGNICESD